MPLLIAGRFEEHMLLRILLRQPSEQIKYNNIGLELCINLTL